MASTRLPNADVDVIIVGAGFAGLYMLHRLRGMGFSSIVLERGRGVGGTWYWNRYPGARCDVESLQYSYQFSGELQQEWVWRERYATQPEILRYAEHVAERFDLKRDILFERRVTAAAFDEDESRWIVDTEDGERFVGRFCVMATGCLSVVNRPRIEGLENFRGAVLHTGDWPHEQVDFSGLRVGVVGTGSSAIQSIPIIARQADRLTVFQRTPNYAVPAQNAPLDPAHQAAVKADYPALRARAKKTRNGIDFPIPTRSALDVDDAAREAVYESRWAMGGLAFTTAFDDLLRDLRANDTLADFIRRKIRAIVKDPRTAELLSPTSIVGCKRLCVDIGYYETYNRPNVELIDLNRAPIERIEEERDRRRRQAPPARHAGPRHRLRRHDRRTRPHRHQRARRPIIAVEMGRRAEDLSWSRDRRFSQSIHRHRAGQPVGADQHAADHRAACGMDRRLPRLPSRPRPA